MLTLSDRLKQIKLIISDVDGVLTDGSVAFDGKGRPFRSVSVRDVTGMTLWALADGKCVLVSGLGSQAVEAIARQWKCAELHMWIKDKPRVCQEIAKRHGLELDQIAFLGDDIIDLRAMQTVGVGVAVADAHPMAVEAADVVLKTPGGRGALRELIERILIAQGCLESVVDQYCSRNDAPLSDTAEDPHLLPA